MIIPAALAGCRTVGGYVTSIMNPGYQTDLERLELVGDLAQRQEYEAALEITQDLAQTLHEDSRRLNEYTRVFTVCTVAHTSVLEQAIRQQQDLARLTKKSANQALFIESLQSKIKRLKKQNAALDTQNKACKKQLTEYKRIDLDSGR